MSSVDNTKNENFEKFCDYLFKSMDVFLEREAKNEIDDVIRSNILGLKKSVGILGSALSASFIVYDEYKYETASRSAEWVLVRTAARELAALGASAFFDAGMKRLGIAGGVISIVIGPEASQYVDDNVKQYLDDIEKDLPLSFTHLNANSSETEGGGGYINIVSDSSSSYIKTGAGGSKVHAGGGDDLVECGSGDNIVDGCDGWDTIYGGSGADSLKGGEGNDTIYGVGGVDTLWGGEGDDVLWGDEGDDVLLGEGGNDTLVGGAGSDELWGDEGSDVIHGGGSGESEDDSDTIHGGDGDDRITVGAGDHYVYGDAGSDIIEGSECSGIFEGGEGNDRITLRTTKDDQVIINGGGGNDNISAFDGDDHLYGDGGNDTLTGGEGGDQLYGGEGDDTLKGGEGEDNLDGGNGSDRLDGGVGSDYLQGDSGFDIYLADDGDTIFDSDGSGSVTLDGLELQGGTVGQSGLGGSNVVIEDVTYIGISGETYRFSLGTLTVSGSSRTITIKNWEQGQLGIKLTNVDSNNSDRNLSPSSFASPLIVDLDGDGIETTALERDNVYFDIDADGIRERSAWVSADDGLLALDRNGDGTINDAGELFGAGATYSSHDSYGPRLDGPYALAIQYGSGFDKLAQLDSNHDGLIDANDIAYADLRVWRDLDGDGQTDEGELHSLSDSGVTSISLASQATREMLNGNLLTDVSSCTTVQAGQQLVGDVWFKFNQRDTEYNQSADVDPVTGTLPNVWGAGRVRDLHTVMDEDAALKGLVGELANLGPADLGKVSALVEKIILRWCGVTDSAATELGRGVYANGAHVAVLEAWNDTPYEQDVGELGGDPRPYAGAAIEEQWDVLARNVAVRLVIQTPLGQQLFPEITLAGGDFLSFVSQPSSTEILARLKDNEPVGLLDRLSYWHAGLRVLDTVYGSFRDVEEEDYRTMVESVLKAEGIDLDYYSLITARIGGDGDDGIVTQSVKGIVYGTEQEKVDSVILGGAGDDELRVGGGKQIVYYGKGQGNDLIHISNFSYFGPNVIWRFEPRIEVRLEGLTLADVTFERGVIDPSEIVMTIRATGETLTLAGAFDFAFHPTGAITFGDGITASFADILTPGALRGGEGADVLLQSAGAEELNGGAGDDILVGTSSATTYVFERGSGHDVLKDSGGNNVVKFGAGISVSDLEFFLDDYDLSTLRIRIRGTDDVLTIDSQFDKASVRQFEFYDGAIPFVPPADFQAELINSHYSMIGTEQGDVLKVTDCGRYSLFGNGGDDTLSGGFQDDFISGGEGNDTLISGSGQATLVGGAGDDVIDTTNGSRQQIVYAKGDGCDVIARAPTISEGSEIIFKDISQDEVSVSASDDGKDVILSVPGGAITLKLQRDDPSWYARSIVDKIKFSDGVIWNPTDITSHLFPEGREQATLIGTVGSDVLNGTPADERLEGGGGNDVLSGRGGSDLYIFGSGCGNDTINEAGTDNLHAVDRVRFTGLALDDVDFSQNFSGTLFARIRSTGETLTINQQFTSSSDGIEYFLFEGGTVLTSDDVSQRAPYIGSVAGENIYGSSGADTLDGAGGNDDLSGGEGDDIYIWRAGSGSDRIADSSHLLSENSVRLEGLTQSDVGVARNSTGDLLVTITATGETLYISQQFDNDYETVHGVNRLCFADGTELDRTALAELAPLEGTHYADNLAGEYLLPDVMIGDGGADTLIGAGGNDTYVWHYGDGDDIIFFEELSSFDTLRLEGVNSSDVTFQRAPNDNFSFEILIGSTKEKITLHNQLVNGAQGIDRVVFGDGSELSLVGYGADLPYAGGATADAIYGDALANTLIGNGGDDSLMGGSGGDSYIWRPGDGNDVINEGAGYAAGYGFDAVLVSTGGDETEPDILRIKGVERDDLLFHRSAVGARTDLVVCIASTGENIVIANYFGGGSSQVEFVVLDDGQAIDLTAIATSLGLASTDGDDSLIGGTMDDTLDGGAGNDVLSGGMGNDTYVVGHTSDDETVYEVGGAGDAIRFADGIAPESVAFRRTGDDLDDLIAEIGGLTRGAVTIKGQFSGDDKKRVEAFRFGDGTVITWQEVEAYLLDQASTNGNDVILGYAGDDVINARGGDDTIIGGGGDDIIVGGAGRDTVVFRGRRREYTVEVIDGRTVVTDNFYYDRDGTDILIDVENLQFASDYGSTTPVSISLAANAAPIAGEAIFSGREDHQLKLQASDLLAHASDPDGDSLRLVSVSGAVGGSVTLTDGMVTFTPAANFAGEASFSYTVADSAGATTTAVAKIAVAVANDAPVSATTLADAASAEDAPFSYTLPASAFTDVDGDTLVLSATLEDGSPLPSWLAFDPASATFSGTPPRDFNGSFSVRVSASDGSVSAEQTFDIVITAVNDAPEVTGAVADTSVRANDVLIQALPAGLFTDVDGDQLSYAVTLPDGTPLPAWLVFDPESRALYGVPKGTDVGSLTLRVTASDGSASASTEFTLTVNPGNSAPVVVTPLADMASAEDVAINFAIPASTFADVDGEPLALTATLSDGSPLPAWLVFDADTGAFSGQPPAEFNGTLAVRVTASDGEYQAASSFALSISPANDAPVVEGPLVASTDVDAPALSINLLSGAMDVDGDALSVANLRQTGGRSVAFTIENGTLTLAPNQLSDLGQGQSEDLVFTYAVTDGNVSVGQNVTVTVSGLARSVTVPGTTLEAWVESLVASKRVNTVITGSNLGSNRLTLPSSITPHSVSLQTNAAGDLFITEHVNGNTLTLTADLQNYWGARHSVLESIGFADGTVWNLADPGNPIGFTYDGSAGYQALNGTGWGANTFLLGADDTVVGGTFNGVWGTGGSGTNTYVFGKGCGGSVVTPGSNDTLKLAAGISQSDVLLSADAAGDLTVTLKDTGDQLTIMGDLQNYWGARHSAVQNIEFADGSVWNLTDASNPIGFTYDGSAGHQALVGTGWGANTFLLGADDTVVGGTFNGVWGTGGSGTNTYVFGKGCGGSVVTPGSNDTLKLAAGISQSDVLLSADAAGDLTVTLKDTGDQLTIMGDLQNYWGARHSAVQNIEFADGSVWNLTDASNPIGFTYDGSAGHQTLVGTGWGANTFLLGADDTVVGGTFNGVWGTGGSGTNTYRIGDTAEGSEITLGSSDSVVFTSGIDADHLWFTQRGNDLLIDVIGSGEEIAIANWANTAASLKTVTSDDGLSVGSQLGQLIGAMATFMDTHPGFDPANASSMPADSDLQMAVSAAWHRAA